MEEGREVGEHTLKRSLGPVNLVALGIGAIIGIFLLRWKRPNAERPYKAWGYPIVPALYIVGASVILVVLFVYQTATTWPGLMIVLTGVPIYFLWKFAGGKSQT